MGRTWKSNIQSIVYQSSNDLADNLSTSHPKKATKGKRFREKTNFFKTTFSYSKNNYYSSPFSGEEWSAKPQSINNQIAICMQPDSMRNLTGIWHTFVTRQWNTYLDSMWIGLGHRQTISHPVKTGIIQSRKFSSIAEWSLNLPGFKALPDILQIILFVGLVRAFVDRKPISARWRVSSSQSNGRGGYYASHGAGSCIQWHPAVLSQFEHNRSGSPTLNQLTESILVARILIYWECWEVKCLVPHSGGK